LFVQGVKVVIIIVNFYSQVKKYIDY